MTLTERGSRMIIIVTVLVALASVAVILRVMARVRLRLKFGIDDYLCLIALVLLYGMLIELILWCTIGGNGNHVTDLDNETLLNFGKIFLANQFTYFILCPVLRISIVCFYQRIFTTRKFLRISCGISWLIGLWGAGIFLACAFQCRPLRGYWDESVPATCFDGNTFFIVNQVFNVVMDFTLLALPLPLIWTLNRSWREKLALSGVFILGGFVCFASIYRIVVLFDIDPADTTYTVYQATLWTHIEPSVGMICSCLPSIRGLFRTFSFSKTRTRTPSSKNAYSGSSASRDLQSANRPNSVNIEMPDVPPSRAESDEVRLFTHEQINDSGGGITIKRKIDVVRHDTETS